MRAIVLLLAGALVACQSPHAPERPPPQPGAAMSAGASGSAGAGTAAGSGEQMGEHMNMQGQREMCQRIMNARTPEERQALMEQSMPDMSREARERHLQMMQQMCH